MSRFWITSLQFFLFVSVAAAESPDRQWILVTAPAYRAALEPLCTQRKAQGYHVTVVETSDVLSPEETRTGAAAKLRERLNRLCRDFKGSSRILLAGAVCKGVDNDVKTVVPPLGGTVGRMKGEPTDLGYCCLGNELFPAVAVGRFPARNAAEAAAMVRKTLDLENDQRPGTWRRRLTVLAGVPAFNPLVDRMVERLALARLDKVDPAWTGRAIYHNAESRFCVPDHELRDRSLRYVSEGQGLTLYLGHSSPEGFWAGRARYLDRQDWAKLRIERGSGVFATFGCTGCQLRGPDGEGYGIAAIRNPHGPAAVLGSHGICFAAMVQLASEGFASSFLSDSPPDRLETAWLALLKGLAEGPIDPFSFLLLDAVDGDSHIPQATQRLEHLEMFVLLGDPALRLPTIPKEVVLRTDGAVRPGKVLSVAGSVPAPLAGARVRVILERTAGSEPLDLEPLPKTPGPERDRVMLANHQRANRFELAAVDVECKGDEFEAKLSAPERVPGQQLILRAYAANEKSEAIGVLRLGLER